MCNIDLIKGTGDYSNYVHKIILTFLFILYINYIKYCD